MDANPQIVSIEDQEAGLSRLTRRTLGGMEVGDGRHPGRPVKTMFLCNPVVLRFHVGLFQGVLPTGPL